MPGIEDIMQDEFKHIQIYQRDAPVTIRLMDAVRLLSIARDGLRWQALQAEETPGKCADAVVNLRESAKDAMRGDDE